MIHTRLSLPAISLLFVVNLNAQTPQKLNIDEATIFLSGAELVSSATVALAKGENEVVFANVAGDVKSQSITVSATNGVVVESATFQNNYLPAEVLSPAAQELKDSMKAAAADSQHVHNKITVLKHEVGTIWKNAQVSGQNTGLSVAELSKYLDLIQAKMEGFLDEQSREEEKLQKIKERVVKLSKQLEEEQKKGYQPGGQLLVKFYAKEATSSAVTIDYIVPHAGWSPTYDIYADDIHSPVRLYYKANIYQNSGVKWNNVHLSLSTGNPNEGVQAPTMLPWYLSFYTPQYYTRGYAKNAMAANNAPAMAGATDDMSAPVAGVLLEKNDKKPATMDEYVSVDNSGVNTTFDIDLPYTIPSDGKQHLVAIKQYELPATYRYYAVPKLDKDAFLQALITNWEDINLLPGETNIFYEGTYVGQGMIDVRNVKDTMNISLGRDKKIVVKRERDIKLRNVKYLGTNVRETFAYTITVRNTRKESINLVVQDQQPVSNDKDIALEDKDTGGAEYDELTGMMKWPLSINPNETKSASFGYTVRYPRGKTVNNLR